WDDGGLKPNDDNESPFAPDRSVEKAVLGTNGLEDWKIVIVDDEDEVHDVTVFALGSATFSERGMKFLSARSAGEARTLLGEHPDAALVLLDVVMENDEAGLQLVKYIRDSLGNQN